MTDQVNLRTTSSFTCPFCKTKCHVVKGEDNIPGIMHEMPMCKEYDDAEDALAFASKARNEMQRQQGIS